MKNTVVIIFKILDILLSPFTILASIWMKGVRAIGLINMPVSKKIFEIIGMMPLREHFYEPLIHPSRHLSEPLDKIRDLPAIDLNIEGQLALLKEFNYNTELLEIPTEEIDEDTKHYYYDNAVFDRGDGEYLYNIIRHAKPSKIIEIGSGNSTLMSLKAIQENKKEDSKFACELICIEPYMQPWLEELETTVIRKKVEDIEFSFFEQLEANDILFIDSSHIIRPQGDVIFEFFSILPRLQSGVLIHVHDIFTPRDYLRKFVYDQKRMWNEQYLLEALLMNNDNYEIIGALNYLKHNYPEELYAKSPQLARKPSVEPGSFWMRKR